MDRVNQAIDNWNHRCGKEFVGPLQPAQYQACAAERGQVAQQAAQVRAAYNAARSQMNGLRTQWDRTAATFKQLASRWDQLATQLKPLRQQWESMQQRRKILAARIKSLQQLKVVAAKCPTVSSLEELKLKCGNVQFDNADPNLPPLL